MEVIKGTPEHAGAVADYWNAVTLDDDSWWFGASMRTPEEIALLLDQGFTLVVVLDGKHSWGSGCGRAGICWALRRLQRRSAASWAAKRAR